MNGRRRTFKPDETAPLANRQRHPPLRPRQRRNTNRSRPRLNQNPAASARRRTRGVDVIHQQNVAPSHSLRIGHKKSAAQIQAALAGSQPRLTLRTSLPHQRPRRKLQPPPRMTQPQYVQSLGSQRSRLVESTLRQPPPMQRNSNHQHLLRSVLPSQLLNRRRQPGSQRPRQWSQAVILQRMNRRPYRPLIHPKAHRPHKSRRSHPAGPALISFRRRYQRRLK